MRATASATTPIQRSPSRAPSAKATSAGAAGRSTIRTAGVAMVPRPMVVSQVTPARRPTTISGTTSTDSPGSSAKAKVPKQTRPVPGSPTSSRTTARLVVSVHHLFASAKRVVPRVRSSAAPPHADHALAAAQPGDRLVERQDVEKVRVRRGRGATVRTTSGRPTLIDGVGASRRRERLDRQTVRGTAGVRLGVSAHDQ